MQIEQPSPEQCDAGDPLLAPSGYRAFACWYPLGSGRAKSAVVLKPDGTASLWQWSGGYPGVTQYGVAATAEFWQDVLARQTVAVQIEAAAAADDKS